MSLNWVTNLNPGRLYDKVVQFFRQNPHLLDGGLLWNTGNPEVLRRSAMRYLDDYRETFGAQPTDPISLERPSTGARTMVYDVQIGSRRYLLRVFRISRASEARIHHDASVLLQTRGVNVPRVIHYCLRPRRYRAVMLLEEFVEGQSLGALRISDSHLRAQARQLARMHSITRSTWGPLDQECRSPIFPVLGKRALRNVNRVRRAGVEVDSATEQQFRRWLSSWSDRMGAITAFSLTHGDIHRANGIFTPDGDYCLIDFARFLYDVAARDVIRYRDKLCRNDAGKFTVFMDEYLRSVSNEVAGIVREFLPFFDGLYSLETAAAYSKRASRSMSNLKARERIYVYWERFLGVLSVQDQ